jgi:hypothetical protein
MMSLWSMRGSLGRECLTFISAFTGWMVRTKGDIIMECSSWASSIPLLLQNWSFLRRVGGLRLTRLFAHLSRTFIRRRGRRVGQLGPWLWRQYRLWLARNKVLGIWVVVSLPNGSMQKTAILTTSTILYFGSFSERRSRIRRPAGRFQSKIVKIMKMKLKYMRKHSIYRPTWSYMAFIYY